MKTVPPANGLKKRQTQEKLNVCYLTTFIPRFLEQIFVQIYLDTVDFIKKVLSVYTHLMKTIYLFLSTQVAKSTFFMKSPVYIL